MSLAFVSRNPYSVIRRGPPQVSAIGKRFTGFGIRVLIRLKQRGLMFHNVWQRKTKHTPRTDFTFDAYAAA